MILMLLLTELVRLDVRLVAEGERVRVQARAGTLSEELRQALAEHKADLLRFARTHSVETIDGPGRLTGHRQEQDVSFVAQERLEVWRYKIGVISLTDGIERFYWPRMVLLARPVDTRINEQLMNDVIP